MSFLELHLSELENEFTNFLSNVEDDEEEEEENLPSIASATPNFTAKNASTAGSKTTKTTLTAEEGDVTPLIQPNAVGLFGPGVNEFWVKKKSSHKKRVRRGLTHGMKLPDDVEILLGQANVAYISGDWTEAILKFNEVTKLAPKLPDPYFSLCAIHEEINDIPQALKFQQIAAKFMRKHEPWCKALDLAWSIKDYEQALYAASRALMFKYTSDVFALKVLILLRMDNISAAEAQLRHYIQQQIRSKDKDGLNFLLVYANTCCDAGYEMLAMRALLTFIRHHVTVQKSNAVGDSENNNMDEDGSEPMEEVESDDESSDGDSNSDSDEENQHDDNRHGETQEEENAEREEVIHNLFFAAQKVFALYVEGGLLSQACRLNTFAACTFGYKSNHDSKEASGAVSKSGHTSSRDSISEEDYERQDLAQNKAHTSYQEQFLLTEFSGLLMQVYRYAVASMKKGTNNATSMSTLESEFQSKSVVTCLDLSVLPLDMQVLFCTIRIGIEATSEEVIPDGDVEDDGESLKYSCQCFLQHMSIAAAVTSLVNIMTHLYKEEAFITQQMQSKVNTGPSADNISSSEDKEGDILSSRRERAWLQEHVILDSPIMQTQNDKDEGKTVEEMEKAPPDMAKFSLDQWKFFVAARLYAAQTLFFSLGMRREARKMMDKLFVCPLLVVDRKHAVAVCHSVRLDEENVVGVLAEEPTVLLNYSSMSLPKSSSSSFPRPVSTPLVGRPLLRMVWKTHLTFLQSQMSQNQIKQKQQQQSMTIHFMTGGTISAGQTYKTRNQTDIDTNRNAVCTEEEDRAMSSFEKLFTSCLDAVLVCGDDDPELLLLLTALVRTTHTNSCSALRQRLEQQRKKQVLQMLTRHVDQLVDAFNTKRIQFVQHALEAGTTHKHQKKRRQPASKRETNFSQEELFMEIKLMMAWVELNDIINSEANDKTCSGPYLAVVLAFIMATGSPAFRKSNQYSLLATHLNDVSLPNSSSVLMTVLSTPQAYSEADARENLRNKGGFGHCLLDHLSSFQVVSLTELSSLIVRPIGYSLYEPETDELRLAAAHTPPLDHFLAPLVSRPLRKLALCVYSMCIQYSKLQYIIHIQGDSMHAKCRKSMVSKWQLDFASGQTLWHLGQNLVEEISNSIRKTEQIKVLTGVEKVLFTTYMQTLFFKPPEVSVKRKIMDASVGLERAGEQRDLSATGALSRKQRPRVGGVLEGGHEAHLASIVQVSRTARVQYLTLSNLEAEKVDDPVQCAIKFSVKLGEFVLSARLISSRAAQFAFALCQTPGTYGQSETCNVHFSRFYRFFSRSAIGLLYDGHEQMHNGKWIEGLKCYLEAYRASPTQPLMALCVATSLFSLASSHPLVKNRREMCAKGLAFFCCYAKHRQDDYSDCMMEKQRESQESQDGGEEAMVRRLSREQEVFFNMGCIYRDLQLNHFAVDFYHKALALEEQYVSAQELEWSSSSRSSNRSNSSCSSADSHHLPLTLESAHNLVLIHKHAGNRHQALTVMRQYLMFL